MKLLNSAMNVSSNEMKKPYVACLLCSSKIEVKLRQHVFIQHSMVSHGQFLAFLFLEIKQYVYFPVEARAKKCTQCTQCTNHISNEKHSAISMLVLKSNPLVWETQQPVFGNILFAKLKRRVAKLQCRLKIGTETGRPQPN